MRTKIYTGKSKIILVEGWLLRGWKETNKGNKLALILAFTKKPSKKEIATIMDDNKGKVDFVTFEQRYSIDEPLPFEFFDERIDTE